MRGSGRPFAYLPVPFLVLLVACGTLGCPRGGVMMRDGGPDRADTRSPDEAGSAGSSDGPDGREVGPTIDCNGVRALAMRGVLTPRRTRQVLFTPHLEAVVLRVAGEVAIAGGYVPDDVLYARLSDGAITTLARGVSSVEWLGATSDLLVTSVATGEMSVVSTATGGARVLGGQGCDHVAAPDGSRVFVTVGCDLTSTPKPLDEIDARTGTTTRIAERVGYRSLVVSTGGGFAAYVAYPGPADAGAQAGAGILHVVDRAHADTTVASGTGATALAFASGELLLFQRGAAAGTTAPDVYRFRAGVDTAASLVAKSRHPGFRAYQVSVDGARLLAARFVGAPPAPDELYAVRIDGTGETLLASDLAPYQNNQIGPSVFAFTVDGRNAVYINDGYLTASAVPAGGGAIVRLGAVTSFVASPFGNRIALVEQTAAHDRYRLRVVEAGGALAAAGYESTHLFGAVTFLAGDRGLVFVEHPDATTVELRHLAFASGTVTLLGRWSQSALTPVPFLETGEMRTGYPVDPTGCYAVVDSDVAGATGTRVVAVPP